MMYWDFSTKSAMPRKRLWNSIRQKHLQKKAQKKKLLILCVVGVFAIAAVVASATLYSMSIKYEQAIFLLDCNRINEAAALFEELGEYKDSAEQFAALMEKSTSNIQD